jgi:glycosyltransferase involved in cell wall biosynthesis
MVTGLGNGDLGTLVQTAQVGAGGGRVTPPNRTEGNRTTLVESPHPQLVAPTAGIVPVTVVFLTFNEEANLADCLQAVAGWAGEILIVDSGSTDATLEIARRYGAGCFYHQFERHTRQWNWALRNLPFAFEWALCLDADQRLTSELKREIAVLLQEQNGGPPEGVAGYYVNRRQIFRGKWIKHGGYYPKRLLKLLRHSRAFCDENELLDSRFYVQGTTALLRHDLIEDNRKEDDISFWTAKHIRYAELQAREELLRRDGIAQWSVRPSLFGSPDQRSLWLRQLWYRHMPLYVRPWLYYFYRYFLRLGFLDGKQGFIFHFLQALWFRLLVDIKIEELRGRTRA